VNYQLNQTQTPLPLETTSVLFMTYVFAEGTFSSTRSSQLVL